MAQKQLDEMTKVNVLDSMDDAFGNEQASFTLKRGGTTVKKAPQKKTRRVDDAVDCAMESMRRMAAFIR